MRQAILLALCLAACTTPSGAVDLRTVATNPASYRGQIVRTCGYATNAFENISITVAPSRSRETPGLEVHWKESAHRIASPEWRCVTGRIEPTCGNAGPSDICVSTGSPYQWAIVEDGA